MPSPDPPPFREPVPPSAGDLPRPEYPRPQFARPVWRNLNGSWSYAFDFDLTGAERRYPASRGFERRITVPFCPESELSGVGHTGFIPAIWYHRVIRIPEAWREQRIVLHFGGVDFETEVFVDGRRVGEHTGGAGAWSVDLTAAVRPGETHHLVVHARDDVRGRRQPAGKQSRRLESYHVYYTRVTGIWQTVWLEPVAEGAFTGVRIVPDLGAGGFRVEPAYASVAGGRRFRATLFGEPGGEPLDRATAVAAHGVGVDLLAPDPRPWSPDDPHLYGVRLELLDADGSVRDRVESYAGLREVRVEGDRVLLNGEPLYQRQVLDQGYWPDGLWTAPSDAALVRDIELARELGFNGARLHQKAFEPRYHFHADRLGWLTWGEMPSWGFDENDPVAARNFLAEWREVLLRDRNHPSIVAWTPLNETEFDRVGPEHRRLVRDAYALTKALDPTRPVNDASGWVHVITDLWTVHLYTQDPTELAEQLAQEPPFRNQPEHEPPYRGQPYLVDEFGGIMWDPDADERAWGYGDAPETVEAFYARLESLIDALLASDRVAGWCYTQLTDVEQERNGLYRYDRRAKFDATRLRAILGRVPADFAAHRAEPTG